MLWNRRLREPWQIRRTNRTKRKVEQKGQQRTKTGAALLLFRRPKLGEHLEKLENLRLKLHSWAPFIPIGNWK